VACLLDDDPEREVQLAAMHTLGALGDESTRVAVEARLQEPDEEMRAAVKKALDLHKRPRDIEALQGAMSYR
jgi:hypothetical protein